MVVVADNGVDRLLDVDRAVEGGAGGGCRWWVLGGGLWRVGLQDGWLAGIVWVGTSTVGGGGGVGGQGGGGRGRFVCEIEREEGGRKKGRGRKGSGGMGGI